MSDFTTLQVFGVPVLTYGLIGLTTGVLAYTTVLGTGGSITKSMESISGLTANPISAMSSVNPLKPDESPEKSPEENPVQKDETSPDLGVGAEGLNPFAEQPKGEPEKVGGKRRRRKTPKSKKSRKSRKSKK